MSKATRYNRKASESLWSPLDLPGRWPGSTMPPDSVAFARAVEDFQTAHQLKPDGMLGPTTFGVLLEVFERRSFMSRDVLIGSVPHRFPATVIRRAFPEMERRTQRPTQVVMHVDTTWDSDRAYEILRRRGLSSHFGIDGDKSVDGYSTLHQWADPLEDRGVHAGPANDLSIGVDVNNPLSLKYASRDLERRGRARPVVTATVRGKKRRNLGFFPEQLNTLNALADLLESTLRIPRDWPVDEEGRIFCDRLEIPSEFHGWTGHFHHPTTHYCPGAAGVVAAKILFFD